MKKLILAYSILLVFSSCEIQYDGETKLALEGRLIDKDGNPISKKNIEIDVSGNGTYSLDDLITYGKSDENGNFLFVFPSPKSNNQISISINDSEINEFRNKLIVANKNNFNNYKLNLNEILLYKKVEITQLRINLNHIFSNKELKNIEIEGLQSNDYINLNPVQNDFYASDKLFNILKNQTVVLKYMVIDHTTSNAVSTEYSVNIPINNDAVTYTITY